VPLILAAAMALSAFHLYQAVTGAVPATLLRPIHLSWVLALVFAFHPLVPDPASRFRRLGRAADALLAAVAIAAGIAVSAFDYESIDHLLYGLRPVHLLLGLGLVALVLEAARRTVGGSLALLALVFLGYAAFGDRLPEAVASRGFPLERIVRFQVYTQDGLYGLPLGIAAGTVYVFVLFGSFLEVSGAGRFFIDLAFAAAGRFRGGPAKASVLASAAMGSISGSAIANTVTTGTLTIPMMKRLGYRADQAAGIEAAASTGGQITPPIMGAGAFIMAELTDTPYSSIVLLSIGPAVLFFLSALLFVHLMACKRGLEGIPDAERPALVATLRDGVHFLLPLALVMALLVLGYSPPLIGAAGCGGVLAASLLRARTRVTLRAVLGGLEAGARMALPVSVACAAAGLVVGVIGQTGIGLQFTEFVVALAGGHLWPALGLIAAAALVLGMGLPVTAAYIVVAVVAAPALESMGLALVTAHLIVFWLSQTSNVTPPIALAAFAGAGIAGANPTRSAIQAFKLSAALFAVPAMMASSDLLPLPGVSPFATLWAGIVTLVLIGSLAFATEGWALAPLGIGERAAFGLAAPLMLAGGRLRAAGVVLALAVFARHALAARRGAATPASPAAP